MSALDVELNFIAKAALLFVEAKAMKVKDLKEILSTCDDNAEIVVYSDSNSRDNEVTGYRKIPLGSCYFGGSEPDSPLDEDCLILEIFVEA